MSNRSREKRDFEIFTWIFFLVILVVLFVYYFIAGFFGNCIFHWPPRWDIAACWHEQTVPAQQKAAKGAEPFFPQQLK